MKILKIRENKLKLSLSSEEAAEYGLGNRTSTPGELRAAVERIFADRRELFRIEERIVVEAYPKMDGSCDVFVTNLSPAHPKEEGRDTEENMLWGFSSVGHLAFALYVLLCERERSASAPLCEREDDGRGECENEVCEPEDIRPIAAHYCEAGFGLGDLLCYLRAKTNNDRTQKLGEALEGCRIYKSERSQSESGCAYILEVTKAGARGMSIGQMSEFATPIQHLGKEVLREHTSELSLDTLLSNL